MGNVFNQISCNIMSLKDFESRESYEVKGWMICQSVRISDYD